jgi:mRNA interferase YafQ
MYAIVPSTAFKKSRERLIRSGKFSPGTKERLNLIINTLAAGKRLPDYCRDHQLKGSFAKYRECHIRGDLLLMYEIIENELVLLLIDIGTHSYFDF